ncbi:MAG: FAD-dependent oxidoreductase [Desulfobacteraceae bacterium]|nr:FAD-dependent oxidoreductase [Desulfobacteraceae bacterium]
MTGSKKQLVLVGGGHAHLLTLARISRFVRHGIGVIVIGPSEYHYYSGMGPGMLGGTYAPGQIRFDTRRTVAMGGGVFVKGKVAGVDPAAKAVILSSGERIPYDVVSFNVGSQVSQKIVQPGARDVFPVKPIEGLMAARDRILALARDKRPVIGIAGGGPSAAEIAGNVRHLVRNSGGREPRIYIVPGSRFLARYPGRVRARVQGALTARGMEIMEGRRVREVGSGGMVLDNGHRLSADLIFLAQGVTPSSLFRKSGLATGPDQGLLVNPCLQSVDYPDIFGGGDCIHFREQPLDKVGVYAVRQNPVLFHNLLARLTGDALISFDPGGDYLSILNLGSGRGMLKKGRLTLSGPLAFRIKDFIDRRFMKRFQAFQRS